MTTKEDLQQDIKNLETMSEYLVDLIKRENERGIPDVCKIYLYSMFVTNETELANKRLVLSAMPEPLKLEDILGSGSEWDEN